MKMDIILIIGAALASCLIVWDYCYGIDPLGQSKSAGEPTLSEQAFILERRYLRKNRYFNHYYLDFIIFTRNTSVTCEVSKSLYLALKEGQGGILTHQGGEFYSLQRNGDIFYDKSPKSNDSFEPYKPYHWR